VAASLTASMNRHIIRLLVRHLQASGGVWLLAALALQFFVTSATWALQGRQELLPGVLLLAVASTRSAPARGLLWQTLPLSRREITLANWWGATILPGLTLSCALVLAIASNHSEGWTVPSASAIILQLGGIWSAFGYTAWLPLTTRLKVRLRAAPRLFLSWSIPLLAAFYGYPLDPRARIACIAIMAIGCALLLLSFLHANAGRAMLAQPTPILHPRHQTAATALRTVPSGGRQIMSIAMTQAAMMLVAGLGGVCLMRLIYPQATGVLLWAFLVTTALWSVLAAQRWTRSLWLWRCLPLPMGRVCFMLHAAQLFPLVLTMGAAWAIGYLAPHHALPMPGWLPPTIVAIVGTANIHARMVTRRSREAQWVRYPLASSTAIAYTTLLVFIQTQTVARQLDWLPALAWAIAILFLVGSFRMTLTELRSADGLRSVNGLP
jgi:hypothetical protein